MQAVEDLDRHARIELHVGELRPLGLQLYGLIVGLSSVSASRKRMNAFMWLSAM